MGRGEQTEPLNRTDPLPEPAESVPEGPAAKLGLWDAVSIIIGIVIGAGIYETAPYIFSNVANPTQALGAWVLGGVLSLIGALCYAELASTYPRSGGDYVYLTRAFGPLIGFLFGWAQLAVILTGSIGMMAYVFADYAVSLWGGGQTGATLIAALAVFAITLLNFTGTLVGKTLQNLLSGLKVFGLSAVVVVGLMLSGSSGAPARDATAASGGGSFGIAMILVLYTFGGWNDAAFVAAEVKDRRRNLPRALMIGTLTITVIYLLVNLAFISALGFEGARQSKAIASDVMRGRFGSIGGGAIAVLVMISALSAINALILTGSRVYASVGTEHSIFSKLARWHPRFATPARALGVQLLVVLVMIAIVGTSAGRAGVDKAIGVIGMAPAPWSGHGGFDALLRSTAPIFWLFFLLTGLSLFVLRRRDRDIPRPFRVPLYPVLPLVFCGTCGYMLYSALDYAGALVVLGAVPTLLGIPLYLASKRRAASLPASSAEARGTELKKGVLS